MNKRHHLALALAALTFAAFAGVANAQGCCFTYGHYSAIALIDRPHPPNGLFPSGGWTLYPGQAGSGVPSMSHYSHISGLAQPEAAAAQVAQKLQSLGISAKPPDTKFLNKNPAIADNVTLPTPKGWLPKDPEEDKEKGKNNKPGNNAPGGKEDLEKPKIEDKPGGKDKDKDKKPDDK